jgi:hypothetical protein
VPLVLHTAAYWLLLTLRDATLAIRDLAKAELATIRLRLLKIGVRVQETASRIRLAWCMARPLCVRLGAGPSGATLVRVIARDEPPPLRQGTYGLLDADWRPGRPVPQCSDAGAAARSYRSRNAPASLGRRNGRGYAPPGSRAAPTTCSAASATAPSPVASAVRAGGAGGQRAALGLDVAGGLRPVRRLPTCAGVGRSRREHPPHDWKEACSDT